MLFPRRSFHPLCLVGLVAIASCQPDKREPDATPAWLAQRAIQEREAAKQSPAFHDFHFTDERQASGIRFVNQVVDDAGKDYKALHYDHGTGLAVADVDGDSLPDLYFVTQLGTNQLWKNLGNGRFADITKQAGLEMPDAISVAASFADIDNDGDPDLFVTTVRHGNHLFENLGDGTFRDITARAGVGYVGHSSGAVFFDYDRDGLLDLFVTNVGVYTTNEKGRGGYFVGVGDAFLGHLHADRAEASILYHNLGGNRFKNVSRETRLVDLGWSGEATVVDANSDGFPDLFVLNMQGQSHLWLNEGGRRFHDGTQTYFPNTPWGAMGVKVFDFDNDGRLDVFVTDMHSDMFVHLPPGDWAAEARKADPQAMPEIPFPTGKSQFIFGNALFANRPAAAGAGRPFVDVSDALGVETYWPWGPSVDDLNADGWDDIFITAGMSFPYRYGINSVLLNESGRHFLPSEFVLGVEPRAGGVTQQPWFQVDCAGVDRGSRTCVECAGPRAKAIGCEGDPAGRVTMTAAKSSRASAIVDLDGDGDLDLVTNEFGAAPLVLISNLAAVRHINFLKVRLRGTRSNRSGLGAQVVVVTGDGRRLLKVMDGKSGYLSQSLLPLYFGLGSSERAASVEVTWPSGAHQVAPGPIAAGQTIEIVEPR